MHCLYCKKRLWPFFSKKRVFCSNRHEAAYHDELSAMNSFMEFIARVEPTANPAVPPVADPRLCNLFIAEGCLKPTPPHAAVPVLLEAARFAGRIHFPASSGSLIDFTLDSAPRPEIAPIASETVAASPVQSKRTQRNRIASGRDRS
jgi:hypothetical protein